MEIVKLKKRGFEKIERNHLWIFSDEIEEVLSDKGVGIANIFYDDKFVGRGLYNGNTKNSLKFLTYKDEEINLNFFRRRFEFAKLRRKQLSPFRREINSEGDLLPGLIVDRFDKTLVVQVRSVALESLKNIIVDALLESYDPESIYERSDFESLPEDGLSRSKGILYGSMPEIQTLEENGLKFAVDVVNGQKTGFFLDQRESRAFVRNFSGSKRALDLFTYTGGFALNMAATGMNVDGIDISESDLEIAKANATINDLDVNFIKKDAFDLTGLGIYDLVIADPPSLIKKKEEQKKAFDLLKNLTNQIFLHLSDDGVVCLCSCAYNINSEMLEKVVLASAMINERTVRALGWTGLPIDHPHLLSMPESDYLKCFWFESVRKKMY